jgi:lipopolysaccharide transport system ATP-binding protein
MTPIIEVKNIYKKYRFGLKQPYYSLRDTIIAAMEHPFSQLKRKKPGPDGLNEDEFWALKDISFNVNKGEVLGIIGRNGAGKSTLLKILSRITLPTKGEIVIRGRIASLLEVGTGFHPELTGRENVYLNGSILGMKNREIKKKFQEIVKFAEIEKFLDTPVKRYSSGMYMRLAFSVAAHLESEIVIIDEVLAVGDADFQKKCFRKINNIVKQGRTVMFVSHSMQTISNICDKVVVLESGKVTNYGDTEKIVNIQAKLKKIVKSYKTWMDKDAPGNMVVKLYEVKIIDLNGKNVSDINIESSFKVRLEYEVLQKNAKFRSAINFYTQDSCAFATIEKEEKAKSEIGMYSSEVVVPANLLSEGDYYLNISIFTTDVIKIRHIYENECVAFHVHDTMTGTSARGDYKGSYGGLLRPKLDWITSKNTIS